MIADSIISEDVPVLKPESTVREARAIFMDYCMCHIPIVKEGNYIGVLPLEVIMNNNEENTSLIEYREDFSLAFADSNQHILNIFEIAAENQLTVIPVTEQNNRYKGAITITKLLHYFAGIYSFRENGGIFTIEVPFRNYDLSEISRIVESNNTKILSFYTETNEDGSKVYITLKVNSLDLKHIKATFERFDYKIDIHYTYDRRESDMKERYDLLMKYLNV